MRVVGYVFQSRFSAGKIWPISIIFGRMFELLETVINFFVGVKTFEISAYVENHIFTKNVNNFETLRQIFL